MKDYSFKCIKIHASHFGKNTQAKHMVVRRVPTDEARRLVKQGWQFAPRSEWKAQGRHYGLGLAGEG